MAGHKAVFILLGTFWLFSAALAASRHRKQIPAISIFSVVQFPNIECTTQSDLTMRGICMSQDDCNSKSGKPDGNCASGFGVCCMFIQTTCDITITRNVTYLANPGFPSAFNQATAQTCKVTVKPELPGICQLRLDFDQFVLSPPAANGDCTTEQLDVVSPTGYFTPRICGTNTGQHMYIETGSQDPAAVLNFNTRAIAFDRKWKVKVSQIPCHVNYKAPSDCLQYHTGQIGAFKSFNYAATGRLLKNMRYNICIRQEEGFCLIAYDANPIFTGVPAFYVQMGTEKAKRSYCNVAHIQIRTSVDADYYCGGTFSATSADTVPGTVIGSVVPYAISVAQYNVDQQAVDVGFSLKYHQLPCGERESIA